ncbi:vWA domain-containing protein [Pendulispora albinea]|uniref:VWA domain-containing protein n=1 Tax=Pendulispora albinea TaxID=2741071 RepID=A0ABZ2M3S3_9BACT
MIRLRSISLAAMSAMIATVAFAGCGSDGGSGLPNDPGGNPGGPNGDNPGGDIRGGGKGDGGTSGNIGDVANCAAATAQSALVKVNLITMFDKSGSMGRYKDDSGNWIDNTAKRWTPVSKGMTAFYSDPKSAGMNATLQYFPLSDSKGNICNVGTYSSPSVGLTPLPNGAFSNSLSATTPEGNTPTEPSLQGAVNTARAILASRKGEKAVVLFVTDGEPNGCSSTVDGAAKIAEDSYKGIPAAGIPSVPVYAIGVGPSTGAIDRIATAGGTTGVHVDVDNPDQTTSQLVSELQKIRGSVMSCSFAIPEPSDKREINFDAVRVNFTNGAGQATTLKYNETCAGNDGWRYDVKPSATVKPHSITLCANTCSTIQGDPNGKINIAFDCKGNGGGPIH